MNAGTKEKVLKIIKELNYQPNIHARRLSLAWGVYSVVKERLQAVEQVTGTALEVAREQGMAASGDAALALGGRRIGGGS